MLRRILSLLSFAALAAAHPLAAQKPTDSAGRDSLHREMRNEVLATLAAVGVADPHGLLMLEGLRAGPELQIRVLEGALPDSALLYVYRAVHDHVDGWPGDTLHMLVRLDADRLPDGAKGREEQPELRNVPEIRQMMNRFGAEHPDVTPGTYTASLLMVVSREGTVPYSIVRESSGNAEVDQFAAAMVQRMRFRPARIASHAVDVWVTLPVTVFTSR